jgi:ATP-dependent protease ClpP protease subunit
MKKGTIQIAGAIGSFKYGGKQINGVEHKDVVSQVQALGKDIDTLEVEIETPGGIKEVGDHIYNYLMSLKPGKRIIMKQIGPIGSIGTKIWFAGDERDALDSEDEKNWFVHNPWNTTEGDAKAHKAAADSLAAEEEDLRSFYMGQLGMTKEGIAPLLDAQTGFTGAEALALRFATKTHKALKTAAYMEKNEKLEGVLDKILAWMEKGKGNPAKALILELGNGQKISAQTEDATKLEGIAVFTVDAQGAPTQVAPTDGPYELKDGRKITVAGGKVGAVTPASPANADNAANEQATAALNAKLDKVLAFIDGDSEQAKIDKAVEKAVLAIRKEMKVTHRPGSFNYDGNKADDIKEWDRSFKANEHADMRANKPELYSKLYFAKHGKLPNL